MDDSVEAGYLEILKKNKINSNLDVLENLHKTIGKSFFDFRAAIPLDWMIGGAKVLPRVME